MAATGAGAVIALNQDYTAFDIVIVGLLKSQVDTDLLRERFKIIEQRQRSGFDPTLPFWREHKKREKTSPLENDATVFLTKRRETRVLAAIDNLINQDVVIILLETFGFKADAVSKEETLLPEKKLSNQLYPHGGSNA